MIMVVVSKSCKLVKSGAPEIYLRVRSLFGRPSPYFLTNDRVNGAVIGGSVKSLERALDDQIANHPGYVVRDRQGFVEVVRCE